RGACFANSDSRLHWDHECLFVCPDSRLLDHCPYRTRICRQSRRLRLPNDSVFCSGTQRHMNLGAEEPALPADPKDYLPYHYAAISRLITQSALLSITILVNLQLSSLRYHIAVH